MTVEVPENALPTLRTRRPVDLYVRGVVKEITAEGANDQANRLSLKYRNKTPYPFRDGETRLTVRVEPVSVHERKL